MNYSKLTVIAEAIRTVLVNDDANTGVDVREIHFYVADRIYRAHQQLEREYPHVTIEVNANDHSLTLPTSDFLVEIVSFAHYSSQQPLTTLDHLSARIMFLLEPNILNATVSSKHLRCRLVQILDCNVGHSDVAELHRNTITLRLQCDDENTNLE